MRELADVYMEARFGKAAALADVPSQVKDYLTMPQLTDKNVAIRNAIEESVRKEKELRGQSKALTGYARKRMTAGPDTSYGGHISDITRAAIPGLSKQEPVLDVGHALAALGGAGYGALRERGAVGSTGRPEISTLITKLKASLGSALKGGEQVSQLDPKFMKTKAIRRMGRAGSFRNLLKTHLPRFGASAKIVAAPELGKATGEAAGKAVGGVVTRAMKGGAGQKATKAVGSAAKAVAKPGRLGSILKSVGQHIPRFRNVPNSRLRRELLSLAKTRKIGLGGWKGALAGAAVASLPFAIRKWWGNRKLRERGGAQAEEAATTAEANIAAAKKLQAWRQSQLEQLQGAGASADGPTSGYSLTPFKS